MTLTRDEEKLMMRRTWIVLALALAALPACEGPPLYSPFGSQIQQQPTSECDDLQDELDACPSSNGQDISAGGEAFCNCFNNASFDPCAAFFQGELTNDQITEAAGCFALSQQ